MQQQGGSTWRCTVCGYVHNGTEPPDVCPVCGASPAEFEALAAAAPAAVIPSAGPWQCLNCNYVHDGVTPPEECPVCGAPRDRFTPVAAQAAAGGGDFSGRLVVVGAGIAGISAIEAFRDATPGGTITLLSRETDWPYYRLNLTRFLAGELSEPDLLIHDPAWFAARHIDVRLGCEVAALHPDERRMELRDGTALPFDRMVLTAGAHAFIPPLPGATLPGVVVLRTLGDARAILSALGPGARCVVIGGGLLGLETAGALAARKAEVTLLEGHDWLMPRQLNRTAGARLAAHVDRLGIRIRRNARTRELRGRERVDGVLLEDGALLPADLVIVATGVRSNSHLGRRIGLEVNQGIVVDNHLRTTHPAVLAAGDVAEHNGILYGSWAAAQFQGRIAGLNAAGASLEFGGLPRSHTLKVLGLDLVSIGRFEPEDGSYQVVEQESGEAYARFVFRDEVMVGCILVGDAAAAGGARRAIEGRRNFSAALGAGVSAAGVRDLLRG